MIPEEPIDRFTQEYVPTDEQKRWGPAEWSAEADWQDSEIRRLVGDWLNAEPGTPGYEKIFTQIVQAASRGSFARRRRAGGAAAS